MVFPRARGSFFVVFSFRFEILILLAAAAFQSGNKSATLLTLKGEETECLYFEKLRAASSRQIEMDLIFIQKGMHQFSYIAKS